MRIVVLDGFVVNPGDLSWDGLKALGEVEFYDRTSGEQVLERVGDAPVIFANKTPLDMHTLFRLQATLKYIGVMATGYNNIDIAAAKECGITVCNVPGYGADSVAQHTFALLLEITNAVGRHAAAVRNGDWAASRDWCFRQTSMTELAGLRLGIVGYGAIGRRVAEIGRAFGMQVAAADSHSKEFGFTLADGGDGSDGRETEGSSGSTERLPLDELFATSDVVSLHCPMTEQNKGFVNARLLGLMKPSAIFLNTARGGLVNEKDLARALESGTIAAAGLDVLSVEPPTGENPLTRARNCVVTPHNAWATIAARRRLLGIAVDNLKAFLDGKPVHVVNG